MYTLPEKKKKNVKTKQTVFFIPNTLTFGLLLISPIQLEYWVYISKHFTYSLMQIKKNSVNAFKEYNNINLK